jgi:hypothetical protein
MALETAMMLEAHHLEEVSISSGIRAVSDRTLEKAKADRTNLNWLIRAYKAATVSEPVLAVDFGQLTAHGEHLTETAHRAMRQCYDIDERYATPHLLDDPDDWFIQLRLPLRSLRMLIAINRAVQDAPLHLSFSHRKTQDWNTVVKEFRAKQKVEKPGFFGTDQIMTIDSPYQLELDNQKPQEVTTVTIEGQDHLDPTVATKPMTFVPTSILTQKGRTDLRHLIRYALVDLRVIRAGGRGRPKQGLLLSPIGQKLAESEIAQTIH